MAAKNSKAIWLVTFALKEEETSVSMTNASLKAG